MNMTNEKELSQELSVLVKEAEAALKKAEAFASKHKLEFNFYPAYGMGGVFGEIEKYDEDEDDYILTGKFGWNASSQSC